MMKIRTARKSELDWINKCYEEVEFVPSAFENEVIAIAEHENQKAGLGRLVTLDSNNLELGGMYVFDSYRGNGIARKIVEFLLSHAGASQRIYCIPFEHLVPFYQQCGFTSCSDEEQIPRDLLEKFHWCKTKYHHQTSLLRLKN